MLQKSESNQSKQLPQIIQPQPQPQLPQQTLQPPQSQSLNHQFLEPPQYVTAIPMQPVISGFSPTGVTSPIQSLDNVMLTPAQTQMQIDLQRKHAELQAIIGQQQAELRRVSEQLLMARLGLLPQNQPVQNVNSKLRE